MKQYILSFLSFLICFTLLTTVSAQTQVGETIVGESVHNGMGESVAISADGNRIAIGANGNEAYGFLAGHARVYEWSGQQWVQVGEDIDGQVIYDEFGASIAIAANGNRVAVGSLVANDYTGFVRIFDWDGQQWVQAGDDIHGEGTGDVLGLRTAVDFSANGNRIALGAYRNDNNGMDAGHVRIFDWDGQQWVQAGDDIKGEFAEAYIGGSVSLSHDGSRIAISTPNATFGNVSIYDWDGQNWVPFGNNIHGGIANIGGGQAVSLSADGTRVAAGAFNINEHVEVYRWIGQQWVQVGDNIVGEATYDRFAYSLDLSADGNRIIVGAEHNDGNGENAGHARIYEWDGQQWIQISVDIEGDGVHDRFGHAVSISADGNRFIIGAPRNDDNGPQSGHVKIFEFITNATQNIKAPAEIVCYPNPTTGVIRLLGVESGTVNIMNNVGKTIFQTKITQSSIDIGTLSPGLYWLQIYADGQIFHGKVIKQ